MSVLSTPVDEHQWLVVLLYSVLLCISVITCDNGGAEQKITGCSGFVKTPAALSQYRLKYDAIQVGDLVSHSKNLIGDFLDSKC